MQIATAGLGRGGRSHIEALRSRRELRDESLHWRQESLEKTMNDTTFLRHAFRPEDVRFFNANSISPPDKQADPTSATSHL